MKSCAVEGCNDEAFCKGYCSPHYGRFNRHGDPMAHIPINSRRPRGVCEVEGCERRSYGHGLCARHYRRFKNHGDPLGGGKDRGEYGAGHVDTDGYRWLFKPTHPNASVNGKIAEHVVVLADVIGRPLTKDESVHHKNGQRADNRPENLELWRRGQPAGQRVSDHIAWAVELIQRYAADPSLWTDEMTDAIETAMTHIRNHNTRSSA